MSKMDTDTKISYKEKMEEEYDIRVAEMKCGKCGNEVVPGKKNMKYCALSAENTNIEWNISLISFLSIRNMRYGVTKSSLAKEFFYMVIYCMVRAV